MVTYIADSSWGHGVGAVSLLACTVTAFSLVERLPEET
jgi:hypothetical protein